MGKKTQAPSFKAAIKKADESKTPYLGHRIRHAKIKERSGLGKAWDHLMAKAVRESRSGNLPPDTRTKKWHVEPVEPV